MTRFNTWSQTSTAYTKPSPEKIGCSVDTRLIVKAVIEHSDRTKLQVDVVGLDLTALIETRQVVE